jgi:hypothetical protein
VTKKTTAMMIALVALTLTGFVFVSRLSVPKLAEGGNAGTMPGWLGASPSASPLTAGRKLSEKQLADDLGERQNLLDRIAAAISAGDWTIAKNLFGEFQSKARQLPAPQLTSPDLSPLLQDFYDYSAVSLERALVEKNARAATLALNQLYGIIGEHRARLETRGIGPEFERLRFLVRELELWSSTGDEKMVVVRASALREAWQVARPTVIARHSTDQAVRDFDQLIEQLAAARQIRDLSTLIPEFKNQIEQLDGLLRAAQKPNSAAKESDDDDQ